MFRQIRVLILVIPLLLVGCLSLPQWRVAQVKVPAPLVKSPEQIEAERQAADLLARKIEKPESLKPVAQGLSDSLGEPKKPIKDSPNEAAIAVKALHDGQLRQQELLAQLNRKLAKYQDKEIEGTGVNLFAPTTGLGFIGLIAACIFVPGFLTFVLFFIRRLYGTLRVLVTKIREFEIAEPEAAEKLTNSLGRAMDRSHKTLVKSLKV